MMVSERETALSNGEEAPADLEEGSLKGSLKVAAEGEDGNEKNAEPSIHCGEPGHAGHFPGQRPNLNRQAGEAGTAVDPLPRGHCCHTCGYSSNHPSFECTCKGPNHVDNATKHNPFAVAARIVATERGKDDGGC